MFLSGLICPLGFSGGFADAMLAAIFAGVLTFLRLYLAASNQRFGDIFEYEDSPAFEHYSIDTLFKQNRGSSRHIFCRQRLVSSWTYL